MYKIVYNKLVLSKDFKKISKADQRKILRAIHKKLSLAPDTFGKPLRGDLKGYYRLRIDYYRVIYRIKKKEVIVIVVHVGLRKDLLAYIETAKRLKKSFKRAAKDVEIKKMAEEGMDDYEEQLEDLKAEEVIFDADRDNKGKGLSPDQMINMLMEI